MLLTPSSPELRPPFRDSARAALRRDPDLVIGWTRDLGPGDLDFVKTVLETGHAMLFFGDREALENLPATYGGGEKT